MLRLIPVVVKQDAARARDYPPSPQLEKLAVVVVLLEGGAGYAV
jgi:hypothetical protein